MDSYELVLIAWSVLLGVWTLLLLVAALDYLQAIRRLDRERRRWLERAAARERQQLLGGRN